MNGEEFFLHLGLEIESLEELVLLDTLEADDKLPALDHLLQRAWCRGPRVGPARKPHLLWALWSDSVPPKAAALAHTFLLPFLPAPVFLGSLPFNKHLLGASLRELTGEIRRNKRLEERAYDSGGIPRGWVDGGGLPLSSGLRP